MYMNYAYKPVDTVDILTCRCIRVYEHVDKVLHTRTYRRYAYGDVINVYVRGCRQRMHTGL